MITLSQQQRAALQALGSGDDRHAKDVAAAIGLNYYIAVKVLDVLRARGLAAVRGDGSGGPRRYVWRITQMGKTVLATP